MKKDTCYLERENKHKGEKKNTLSNVKGKNRYSYQYKDEKFCDL